MVTRKTEQPVLPVAELLREMSQCHGHLSGIEPDAGDLLRLADDPLALGAFLRRGPAGTRVPLSHREAAAAGLSYPIQRLSVPIREIGSPTAVRRYPLQESRTGTSLLPVAFNPSVDERMTALNPDAASTPERPALIDVFSSLRLGWPAFALVCAGVSLILFLGFG